MELVFATHNQHKLEEVRKIVPAGISLRSLNDIDCFEEIEESGTTLAENAGIKADYVTETYGLPCFSDDSGLFVDYLNGAPGVHSARYAGEGKSSEANIQKLLTALDGKSERAAHFTTVIALNLNGRSFLFEGVIDGEITTAQQGEGGFGYDPIFIPKGYDRTFAQLPPSVKNKISHRAIATERFIAHLLQYAPS